LSIAVQNQQRWSVIAEFAVLSEYVLLFQLPAPTLPPSCPLQPPCVYPILLCLLFALYGLHCWSKVIGIFVCTSHLAYCWNGDPTEFFCEILEGY